MANPAEPGPATVRDAAEAGRMASGALLLGQLSVLAPVLVPFGLGLLISLFDSLFPAAFLALESGLQFVFFTAILLIPALPIAAYLRARSALRMLHALQPPAPAAVATAWEKAGAAVTRAEIGLILWCLLVGVMCVAIPGLLPAKLSANETAALATLRNLASRQAEIRRSGTIDCDGDGIGEYGTFLELTGSVGVRKSADGSVKAGSLKPPLLSPALSNVDPEGIVTKSGYCFRIYLPDSAPTSGFVHETGPAEKAGLKGGTAKVGVDVSEKFWCAYAWPVSRGNSGNRCFFVNQAGDVMQSNNDVARWSGYGQAPPPDSGFRGHGASSPLAVGTRGMDGEVWKVTN